MRKVLTLLLASAMVKVVLPLCPLILRFPLIPFLSNLKTMKRKNPRLCKVLTILPSSYREELVSRLQAPLAFVSRRLDSVSESIKDSFSVLQKDLLSYHVWTESCIDKVFFVSIASLVVSVISLILLFYV